ncbi:hypothetical protein Ade02nite_70590 [Paractinoplanes deccanensis]|uniref:UspA domain-containing protein n=1 Tax=Paractinoplanes deccanensis TaxID=113561 RepID=A0ABQ3YEL2_9ACTN|nr:universal stress protein [Actinoplanes deccanensis]GID78418.1 hypothetical protein Ade02nite_70590 [Actinoplanes deccanensis]
MATATLPLRPGTRGAGRTTAGPVVVAVDDDDNAGALLRHGRREAGRLGVPLRVAYVWSDCRPPDCPHHRRCHRDLGGASRLVDLLVREHLAEPGPPLEREVLHDPDPAAALVALSAGASLLVIGSSSDRPAHVGALGGTTRAVLGRTRCPVAVVPHRHRSVTRPAW